jgi:RNA ligase
MKFEHFELLQEMVRESFVSAQKHTSEPLWIYNYTPRTQYSRTWNEATMQARGLILNESGEIMQRPFRKFFNLEECESGSLQMGAGLPVEPFEVTEKMDGSLGILYWSKGIPGIATRGSFTSDQSQRATKILHTQYPHTFSFLKKDRTYLFEIIYPENRIVVDYGETEDLVLLAIMDNETGRDLPLENIGFPLVKRYDGISDVSILKAMFRDNAEGFVVRFESGMRVKVKFAEYVRLHRIITQCSSKVLWEHLSNGLPLNELLERVPDEFYQWVRKTTEGLTSQFEAIERECKADYCEKESRKDTALYFQTKKHARILFAMLDKKDYAAIIWKAIKPEFSKPFKIEVE